jgi:hypothetical protein
MRCAATIAGLVLPALVVAGCSVRVGQGGPPDESADGTNGITAACSREGKETKLAFGKGTSAFAFVWDTDHYVVAYVDPSTGSGDIFVVKMGADGTPLGAPVDVQPTDAVSDLPSIVKTPSGYLVVWQEGTAGQAVLAHALAPDATPVGAGSMVAATQSDQSRPVVARAPGGQVAVAWMDIADGRGGAQLALVDPSSLQVAGPQRIAASDVDGWPWVSGDDTTLAVAWSDDAGSGYDVQFASVDQSLALSGQCSLRDGASSRTAGLLPRMVREGGHFFAAWENQGAGDNAIYSAIVDASGHRLGGGLVEEPKTGDANWPNAAWTGAAAAIVYYQWRSGRPQIYLTLLDGTGARVANAHDLQVSAGEKGWSKYPDVAWTGNDFGVVYVDTRDGSPELWMQRVSCKGG